MHPDRVPIRSRPLLLVLSILLLRYSKVYVIPRFIDATRFLFVYALFSWLDQLCFVYVFRPVAR